MGHASPPPRTAPAGWLFRWLPPGSNGRGVAYTLAGAGVPAVIALAAIPRIASILGPERFGILILAWTAIGYAVFLQLGLGRAAARHASADRRRDSRVLAPVVWTALAISGALGAAAAGALFFSASAIARGLHVPPAMVSETATALRLLAFALPFTVTAPVLGGVLEARRRFGLVNAVAMPTAALTYLGPLAVLAVAPGLVPVVAVLCAARLANWCALAALCLREIPRLRSPRTHRRLVKPLLAYGGWATVSAIVSPLLVYLDRFVVAAMASAAAAAYYGTGQEVALRLGIASGAVVTVLFPAFAAVPRRDGARLAQLLERGVAAVALLVLPLSLLLAAFAGDLLRLWIGPEYAAEGEAVLAWLAAGLLVNGLAKVPSTLLQAIGRPDLTAWLHLAELPLFVAVLGAFVWRWGIEGAAMAWLARVSVDCVALFWVVRVRIPETRRAARAAAAVGAGGAAGIAALRLLPDPGARGLLLAVIALAFAAAWLGSGRLRASVPGLRSRRDG